MEQGASAITTQTQIDSRSTEHKSSCNLAPDTASTISWTRMQHLRLLIFSTIVSTALGTLMFFTVSNRDWLHGEDNVVESLSVLFYGLAFVVAMFRWTRCWQSKHRSGWLPGVAALGVLGALEELSYGQRVLEFSVPLIAGVEFDALHDIANIAYEILRQSYATNAALMITVIAGCVGLLVYGAVRYGSKAVSILRGSQSLLILTFLVFLIVTALVIDLEIVKFELLRIYEEIFEMNAAFAVFLLSLVVNKAALEE